MKCRAIKPFDLPRPDLTSLNTPPFGFAPPKAARADSYLCEDTTGLADLKKTIAFTPMMASGIWAPLAASPKTSSLAPLMPLLEVDALAPPPDAAFSFLLYQVLTQMKDFELTASLKTPVINKDRDMKVNTQIRVVLGEQGRLNAASLRFDPYWGPLKLPHPVTEVVGEIPIIGIFAIYRMLSVEMDPASRRIVGKGLYLFAPIDRDLQDGLVEQGKIPEDLVKGPGYDLRRGIPEYTWQASNIAEQILSRKTTEGFEAIGEATKLNSIVPLFEKGEVQISGDFSNQEIQIGNVKLLFFPKHGKDPQRLQISGGLTAPRMKVWGLKGLEIKHAGGTFRAAHLEENAEPLELQWKFNLKDLKSPQVDIAQIESQGFVLENESLDPGKIIAFTLKRGLTLKNLWFSWIDGSPHLHVASAQARQGELTANGLQFRTSPDDQATLEQIHLEMKDGFPEFHCRLQGHANGELDYSKDGESLAWLKFRDLQGKGSLATGRDARGEFFFRVGGDFSTHIPALRFLVKSEEMKGQVKTEIGEAVVQGQGALTVWPNRTEARLEKLEQAAPFKISGSSGKVDFHQDVSQVQAWPEAREKLGPIASKLQTDFHIDVHDIGFEVERMDLKRSLANGAQPPSLEITRASFSDIRIRGDLSGLIWARLPGGILHPFWVPPGAKMLDATVRIGALTDFEKNGHRRVFFRKIFLSGTESRATLSPFDQKRCGFDRQSLHAELGLFGFDPESKNVQLRNLGKQFEIHLKNPTYLGGCLKVD